MSLADSTLLQLLSTPIIEVTDPAPPVTPIDIAVKSQDTVDTVEPVAEVAEPTPTDNTTVRTKSSSANSLSDLFTEKAIAILSELPSEKLLSMSLKEALAEVSVKDVSGPWVAGSEDGQNSLTASFTFDKYYLASDFLNDVLCQSGYVKSVSNKFNLQPLEKEWSVSITLKGTAQNSELSSKELQLAQYANYRYTSQKNPSDYYYDDDYRLSDEVSSVVEEPKDKPFEKSQLPAIPFQVLSDGNTKTLRVPIAVLGEWEHPDYGQLTFTQQDFDDMKSIFSSNVLGYEPPLFLGHPNSTNGTTEGSPAEGFLDSFNQEGDVLYGNFGVVNDDTYTSVDKGQYRYASGEFIRNYSTKQTGEKVGTALVGVALTNRPFLTGLPRVKALSDSNHIQTILLTDTTMTIKTEATTPASTSTTEAVTAAVQLSEFKQTVMAEFTTLKEEYSDNITNLKQQLSELTVKSEAEAQKLSEVTTERDNLAARVAQVESEKLEAAIAVKLTELNSLAIPVEEKQKYSDLIKSGALGENEEVVMASLRAISTNLSDSVTQQHGSSTSTQALNDSTIEDPYAATITRNQSISAKREERLTEILGQ